MCEVIEKERVILSFVLEGGLGGLCGVSSGCGWLF